MNAEVFISYASEDRERILDLVERLRGAGVSVWIDQMGIEGATMWSQEIVEAIDSCKVLILATGFKVFSGQDDSSATYPVVGPGGASLDRFWSENRLQAYEGVSVPGFPNYFTVFGPYGYVGSSYFALIEAQSHHIVRCVTAARVRGATRVEIKSHVISAGADVAR